MAACRLDFNRAQGTDVVLKAYMYNVAKYSQNLVMRLRYFSPPC